MHSLPDDVLLRVRNLKKHFKRETGVFRKVVGTVEAVNDISLDIRMGETVGLVGESGCGKTTTARTILRAIDPTAGEVLLRMRNGDILDLTKLKERELKEVWREVQMVFQDPFSSLNPRFPVVDIVAEQLKVLGWKKDDYRARVRELLDLVGLSPDHMGRYPHAFSGGQRQRIGIARALASSPRLIIADEPVSALDVSVQAQILNLLSELQSAFGLAYLFVAHDLSVVHHVCDRVVVMYLGRIVEQGPTDALFEQPLHPYTSALIQAVPDADPHRPWDGDAISNELADTPPNFAGCPFAPRCPFAIDRCTTEVPTLRESSLGSVAPHSAACHRMEELRLPGATLGT